MAEDRKKMLEALVAKRKAEAEAGSRGHKSKPSSLSSKTASVHKSSPLAHKPTAKPSPLLQQKKHQHHKKESPPNKKKKRVEKYDTEDDDDDGEDDESDGASDSDEEPVKKKVPFVKGGSAAKASSLKPSPFKGKQDIKAKASVKETAKGKRKSQGSSDDEDDLGSGDEDEEAAEADSGDEGLDTSNIIQGRTRGRGAKPVHYDFTNMSGDDDDDSD